VVIPLDSSAQLNDKITVPTYFYKEIDQATISRIENKKQGKDIHLFVLMALFKYFPEQRLLDFLDREELISFNSKFIEENKVSKSCRV